MDAPDNLHPNSLCLSLVACLQGCFGLQNIPDAAVAARGCLWGARDHLSRIAAITLCSVPTIIWLCRPVAAELRVFPGQYIVQTVGTPERLELDQGGGTFFPLEQVGLDLLLVGANGGSYSAELNLDGNKEDDQLARSTPVAIPYRLLNPTNDPRTDPICSSLIASGQARGCSPNFEVRISGAPNDPLFSSQWGLSSQRGIGIEGVGNLQDLPLDRVVAVVDTGIDTAHPDLAPNLWINTGEIPGNGIDDDLNGFVDDVHGVDVITGAGLQGDDNGHGTHVAGIIGARGNNSLGIAGVSWNARLMGIKFLDSQGSGSLGGALKALSYVLAMKARGVPIRVVNNSWGGIGYSSPLEQMVESFKEAGMVFVVAAGNSSVNLDEEPQYPGAFSMPHLVSVTAVAADGSVPDFANTGARSVHIGAPGAGILSSIPGRRYAQMSGTSMAAPHVAGALDLLFAIDPLMSPSEAIARLLETGRPASPLVGKSVTGRVLDLARLVRDERLPLPPPPSRTCEYALDLIPFQSIEGLGGSRPILVGDELGFRWVSFPFAFPFYGKLVTSAALSPNGVAYLGEAPTAMDFRNRAVAPNTSIAALHTDLVMNEAPLGVRTAVINSRLVIEWYARRYVGGQVSPIVRVQLALSQDGGIEQFIDFGTIENARELLAEATVGIAGSNTQDHDELSLDSQEITTQLGFRLTPLCPVSGSLVEISKIRVSKGRKLLRSPQRATTTSNNLLLSLAGQGSGTVELTATVDGTSCGQSGYQVVVDNGRASVSTTLPSGSFMPRSIKFSAGGATVRLKSEKILGQRFPGEYRNRARSRRMAKRATSKWCRQLFKSMEQQ